ncbi:MAG: hypothetical protein CVV07_11900 [Gammaproteobacteria bacterium HGW-Gammaproteobacteria-11]|nr:MAG: hypothetical protein CVV07_11900 [Gammaproteobacteria bacterium HGW-Gammaproteobacteria-11]
MSLADQITPLTFPGEASQMSQHVAALTVSRDHFATTLKALGNTLTARHGAVCAPVLDKLKHYRNQPRIPLLLLDDLIVELEDATGDPCLLSKAFGTLNYRPSLLRKTYLAGAMTRREALHLLCRYFRVNSEGVVLTLHAHADGWSLDIASTGSYASAQSQRDGIALALVRTLEGLGITAVRSGQPGETCIQLVEHDLDAPLGWASCPAEQLGKRERYLLRQADTPAWGDAIKTLLPLLYRHGSAEIDHCAALLATSRRTLQRSLGEEQLTFRVLVEQTRKELAAVYLRLPYPLEQVACLLGFQQSAQFYRVFRQWFGCSPAEYRQHLTQPVHPPH